MASQLSTKVKLYCEANGKTPNFDTGGNISLKNSADGNGDYIASWTVDGLTKPTDEQLASYETSGNTVEKNSTVRYTRKLAYGDIGDQLDDLYKNGVFSDDMTAKIKAVKDANPKPT